MSDLQPSLPYEVRARLDAARHPSGPRPGAARPRRRHRLATRLRSVADRLDA